MHALPCFGLLWAWTERSGRSPSCPRCCKGLVVQLFYLCRLKANTFGEITRVPRTLVWGENITLWIEVHVLVDVNYLSVFLLAYLFPDMPSHFIQSRLRKPPLAKASKHLRKTGTALKEDPKLLFARARRLSCFGLESLSLAWSWSCLIWLLNFFLFFLVVTTGLHKSRRLFPEGNLVFKIECVLVSSDMLRKQCNNLMKCAGLLAWLS